MSSMQTTPAPELCGTVTGNIKASIGVAPFDPVLERSRATWMAGNFAKIAVGFSAGAAHFVERLALAPGESVLDVACGSGNLSLPAARDGAEVTGVDIAPNLVEAARRAAAAASLEIRFDVAPAESMPYATGSFDTVMSMFGVMFSLRPEQALSELLRVTRRGGRIALANWTPDGFVGQMLRAHAAMVPPPAGMPSPLAWGDEASLRRRLAPHAGAIRDVQFVHRTIAMTYPLTPGGVVELFREYYGPSVRAFAALDAPGRAALEGALLRLWASRNRAPDDSTAVNAEYLEVLITLAS